MTWRQPFDAIEDACIGHPPETAVKIRTKIFTQSLWTGPSILAVDNAATRNASRSRAGVSQGRAGLKSSFGWFDFRP